MITDWMTDHNECMPLTVTLVSWALIVLIVLKLVVCTSGHTCIDSIVRLSTATNLNNRLPSTAFSQRPMAETFFIVWIWIKLILTNNQYTLQVQLTYFAPWFLLSGGLRFNFIALTSSFKTTAHCFKCSKVRCTANRPFLPPQDCLSRDLFAAINARFLVAILIFF